MPYNGEDAINFPSLSWCLHFSVRFLGASVVDTIIGAGAGIKLVPVVDAEAVVGADGAAGATHAEV